MEKILILGGTNFIGRNLVEKLMSNKRYELTLLNRGITNPTLFPNIKRIIGDRNNKDIGNAIKEDWDYVIDLSCYYLLALKNIIEALSTSIKKYIFISTCSVYLDEEKILRDESASIQKGKFDDFEDDAAESYGKRKSKCEELLGSSNLNYTILRPSLVFGKYDITDRFYYWLYQVKKIDEILIPSQGKQQFSITYIDDLIESIYQSIKPNEDRDTYNVTSKYLQDKNVRQWFDMPLWIDSDFFTFKNEKLLKAYKIKITDFEKSIKDTVKYYEDINWPIPKYGILRQQQIELMMSYKNN